MLGRIAGTTSWAPLSSDREASQVPGVLAVLFATPLWYANAVHFHAQLKSSLARTIGPPRLVVLDTIGMSDLDYTGVQVLREVLDEFDRDHIAFGIARSGKSPARMHESKRSAVQNWRRPVLSVSRRGRHCSRLEKSGLLT